PQRSRARCPLSGPGARGSHRRACQSGRERPATLAGEAISWSISWGHPNYPGRFWASRPHRRMTTIGYAMPEANVLYIVTTVVVLGLALWVAFVLRTAKEPWSRPAPVMADVSQGLASAEKAPTRIASDPDSTAPETPLALSEGRPKVADDVTEPPDGDATKAA